MDPARIAVVGVVATALDRALKNLGPKTAVSDSEISFFPKAQVEATQAAAEKPANGSSSAE